MISVIIPVKNGASTLNACLKSIKNQKNIGDVEIIILDSGSTDSSIKIAAEYSAKVINIDPGTFNHGLTRNLGASQTNGNLLFFTVQDARLSDNYVLYKMASHFKASHVMGVCGHQAIPHEKDKNPFFWIRRISLPEVVIRKLDKISEYKEMSEIEKRSLLAWDNVIAMYRKDAFNELPFEKADFCEDWLWSFAALKKGWTLIYDPSLITYHYHHPYFRYTFNTIITINYHLYHYFKIKPSRSRCIIEVLRVFIFFSFKYEGNLKEKFFWISVNIKRVIAEFLANTLSNITIKLANRKHHAIYKYFVNNIPQGKTNSYVEKK